MDFMKKLGFIYNPDDDTVTRLSFFRRTTTESHNSLPNQTIFTQDIPLNTTHNTWLRLYRPISTPSPPHTKLPLILYFHGGGFVICSAFDTSVHDFCASMATDLPAVVVSLEYRLAPENRLPAAYEDAVEALVWIQNEALGGNHMLKDFVDFSKCYLMGSSAGGNLAYNAGLRALCSNLEPLVIRGYIFDHPFFTGLKRSESELRLANDKILPLAVSDLCAELSLPKGCDRDHEYLNPLVDGSCKGKIGMLGRCFLNTNGGDLTVDYGMEFVKMLERKGVSVVTRFQEGGSHCMDIKDPGKAKILFAALKEFVSS